MSLIVSAPGKLMIAGEYAVLHGAECLVAAVSRRARVRFGPAATHGQDGTLPPDLLAAKKAAEEVAGPISGHLSLDLSELRGGATKLGLGSSSAAAAAGAGLVFAVRGQDLNDLTVRRQILAAALEGHRTVSPAGSGADVAAGVLGGFLRYRAGVPSPDIRSIEWPTEVILSVIWTGQAASTAGLVARVQELEGKDRRAHQGCMDAIEESARRLIEAALAHDVPTLIASTEAHGRAMRELGRAAGAPIVEERLEAIMKAAREAGGAAKPSGAGGGDVAIGLFPDTSAAAVFEHACATQGAQALSLELGVPGVRVDHDQGDA